MSVPSEEAAKIDAIADLSKKFGDVLNFDDIGLSLNALADTAACLINGASDPETVRNQFVAALDQALDMLTFMLRDLDGRRP